MSYLRGQRRLWSDKMEWRKQCEVWYGGEDYGF